MTQKTGSMTCRVEDDLQAAFVAACKRKDVTAAQVLRSAMRDYLARNAQQALPLDSSANVRGKANARRK